MKHLLVTILALLVSFVASRDVTALSSKRVQKYVTKLITQTPGGTPLAGDEGLAAKKAICAYFDTIHCQGLPFDRYGGDALAGACAAPGLASQEVLLFAVFRYIADVKKKPKRILKKGAAIVEALVKDPAAYLEGLEPPFADYDALSTSLCGYFDLLTTGAQVPITPETPAATLTARLASEGFEGTLQVALEAYQASRWLPVTGVLDEATIAALDVPLVDIAKRIVLALEGMRTSGAVAEDRFVHVNIPTFELDVYHGGAVAGSFVVGVGRTGQDTTPELEDKIIKIIFNPYWWVPPRIQKYELEVEEQKKKGYLASKGFSYYVNKQGKKRLVQKPGPENFLGQVSFAMTNWNGIILHGTPSKEVFGEQIRMATHGCVILEKPESLAELLMTLEDEANAGKAASLVATNKIKSFKPETPWPVFLTYFPAAISASGHLQIPKDIYKKLGKRLATVSLEGIIK